MSTPAQNVPARNARRQSLGIDWAEYAESYDVMARYNVHYAENVSLVAELIRKYSANIPARICDLGAGTGNYLAALSSQALVANSFHVDSSAEMNALADRKYLSEGVDAEIVLEDVSVFAGSLPACDVYLCINCLYAIPERDEFIRRIGSAMPVDAVLIALDFGRRLKIGDWIPSMARAALALDGPKGLSNLLSSGLQIAKHNSTGADGQAAGLYWLHTSAEFDDFFVGHGLEVVTSGVCYKGYCDYAVVRR